MYIKKLELLNFQVIEKFSAEFDGAVYFVTGENEIGKSTLLKAVGALLTGQRDDVLSYGADKGFARMVVGDDQEEYQVQLSFTEANPRGTLTIKQKSTGNVSNNVSMLQNIFGYQDFDAVEFSRWSETAEGRRKQIAVVMSLIPEPFRSRITEIDSSIADIKAERTEINRDVKTFSTLYDAVARQLEPGDEDKYTTPADVSELMKKQEANMRLAEKAREVRAAVEKRTQQLAEIPARLEAAGLRADEERAKFAGMVEAAKEEYERALAEQEMAEARISDEYADTVAKIQAEQHDYEQRKANGVAWLAKYDAISPEANSVPAMLAQAEEHNRKFNLVCQVKEKRQQLDAARARASQMDAEIAQLTEERANLIAGADLPVQGLAFTEEGLTLHGVPFVPGKVSDSQTMEVAAKLVIASNPTVKVFRIARGESLGAKRLQTIIDIAKRNGFQGFIEQVQRGQNEMIVEEYTEG